MSYTNSASLEVDHNEWVSKLDFYKKDIHILEERLAEIATKNTAVEARAGVEHFQNQFIVQRNNIDELKHAINENAHLAFEDAKAHAGRIDSVRIGIYKELQTQVATFEKSIKELRHEFNEYSSKWM